MSIEYPGSYFGDRKYRGNFYSTSNGKKKKKIIHKKKNKKN